MKFELCELRRWSKSMASMRSDLESNEWDQRGDGAIHRSIDGIAVKHVVRPRTAKEAAEVLVEAASLRHGVIPTGAGTAMGLGNVPEKADLLLSTAHLTGIIDYEPTDLVLSVAAGTPLSSVQSVLAEHGQELPIDPPNAAFATIGGLVATALIGPRRLGSGTLRDLLIGISVAHPNGAVTKAGGMVVKNVTGYDLARLYHGSLGTLGLIVSANFKVLPSPRDQVTLLFATDSLSAACELLIKTRTARIVVEAAEAAWFQGQWIAALRLMGRSSTVRRMKDEVSTVFESDVVSLVGAESVSWWSEFVLPQACQASDDVVIVRCAGLPSRVQQVAERVIGATKAAGGTVEYLTVSVGVGSLIVRSSFASGGPAMLATWQRGLMEIADQVTILTAPSSWKRDIDVWGRPSDAANVMRRIKHQFDPDRVLNPGRFAAGI